MIKKNKIIFFALLISFFASGIYFFYPRHLEIKSSLSDEQMDFLKSDYGKQVKAIDDASGKIIIGNAYFGSGNYEEASKAYETAYALDSGSRTFIGFKLIDTYEEMGRYDEALSLLNKMEKPSWSKKGHVKAAKIRSRLLTKKKS